jgi:hypothetical protein
LNAPVLVTSPSAPLYIRAPSAARTLTVSVDVRTTTRSGPANSTLPAKTAVPGSPPAEQRLAAGLLWPDTGLFFVRPNGAAWHPNSVTQRFRRLVARAGLPPIRLHDLRHGAATMALDAGVDIKSRPGATRPLHLHPHPRHLHQRRQTTAPQRRQRRRQQDHQQAE